MRAVKSRANREETLNYLASNVYTMAVTLNTLSVLLESKATNVTDNPLTDVLHGTANMLKLCDESLDDITGALRELARQEGAA